MINEKKMIYLNKYTLSKDTVKILNYNDVVNLENNIIPTSWNNIFLENDKNIRINKLMNIWNQYVEKEMSNTIAFLNKFLIDVELIKIGKKYSILYSIKTLEEQTFYYEGGNPLDKLNNDQLKKDWNKIPYKIREFYENVHNGFYYYASKSMGLESFDHIAYLDQYDWGIIEEIGGKKLQLDLKTSYSFFSNGIGDYVVIDYSNCDNNNATLWSSKEEPEYNIKFWDVVDEWTVIGFTC